MTNQTRRSIFQSTPNKIDITSDLLKTPIKKFGLIQSCLITTMLNTRQTDNFTTGYVAGLLQEILDLHEVCELEADNGPRLGETPSRPHEGWHTTFPPYISSTMGSTLHECCSETELYGQLNNMFYKRQLLPTGKWATYSIN